MIEGFVPELHATVRECIDCSALVPGGPTRCVRCAEMSALPAWKRRILWWFRIYKPGSYPPGVTKIVDEYELLWVSAVPNNRERTDEEKVLFGDPTAPTPQGTIEDAAQPPVGDPSALPTEVTLDFCGFERRTFLTAKTSRLRIPVAHPLFPDVQYFEFQRDQDDPSVCRLSHVHRRGDCAACKEEKP